MNKRNWLVLGLALVLASTLIVSVPGSAQAQQNDALLPDGSRLCLFRSGQTGLSES